MRIYAGQLRVKARVVDLDTGRPIRGVLWVDEELGQAEAYRFNDRGERLTQVCPGGEIGFQTVMLKGRFKLVPAGKPVHRMQINMGASKCAKCSSPLTLRGDELCPACRRREMGRPIAAEQCGPFEFRRCERCSADATWSVVDEVEATPSEGSVTGARRLLSGRYLFDRRAVIGRRYFCSKHFQGPRLVDARGEVISTEEGGLCPDTIGKNP